MVFTDRVDAGRRLGAAVQERLATVSSPVLVLGIPRGGVIVAREVATMLGVPLDVVVTRKLGAPWNPELGIGALTEEGIAILDDRLVKRLNVSDEYVRSETERQAAEVKRRVAAYRGDRAAHDPRDRCCVVVDDGLATGGTMRSALAWVRHRGASTAVLAVPVASDTGLALSSEGADIIVCLDVPVDFAAVGQWYDSFEQVSDAEVIEALREP